MTNNKSVLTQVDRDTMRDNLNTALNELDVEVIDRYALRRCISYQREALCMAHRRFQALR